MTPKCGNEFRVPDSDSLITVLAVVEIGLG